MTRKCKDLSYQHYHSILLEKRPSVKSKQETRSKHKKISNILLSKVFHHGSSSKSKTVSAQIVAVFFVKGLRLFFLILCTWNCAKRLRLTFWHVVGKKLYCTFRSLFVSNMWHDHSFIKMARWRLRKHLTILQIISDFYHYQFSSNTMENWRQTNTVPRKSISSIHFSKTCQVYLGLSTPLLQ